VTLGNMNGQVVLVTGGAGGIGTGISRKVAEAGARVVLIGRRSAEELQAAADALPGNGHWGASVSVEDSAALTALADEIEKKYGRLDILVNNAAITKQIAHDDLDALDDDFIDQLFRVNWRGSFACVRAMRRLLEGGDGGVIFNVSSAASKNGMGSNIAYCASKAAINTMTVSLARVLAPKVRVFALSPGFVDTGFVSSDPAWVAARSKAGVMDTAVPVEALGEAVVALTTGMAYSTGCFVPVDGGRI
jgi:3-oxoacyl-[acyl-carrier protein] reductase